MPLPFTYFVKNTTIVSAASNSNDGRDPLGCALSNASYDHTGGASGERQLTAASGTPFSSVIAGDYIYLMNAVGGVADGLYEIASKVSSTVVLLAADSGLTSDSTGDVDSSDGPWLTVQYALDQLTNGDDLVICNDGTGTDYVWDITTKLDIDQASGSEEGINVRGGSARGAVDGTKAVLDGTNLPASTNLLEIAAGYEGWRFFDLDFQNATLANVIWGVGTFGEYLTFIRCGILDAGLHGCYGNGDHVRFIDCEIAGNSNNGVYIVTTDRGHGLTLLRCAVHDNGANGVRGGGDGHTFIDSLFFDNAGDGIEIQARAASFLVSGCNFFGNTGDGISVSGTSAGPPPCSITNSIFRSNGGYGINVSSQGTRFAEVRACCFSNNTSGATSGGVDFFGPNLATDDNVYSDPSFTSETDGSEDFTLEAGSPCIDAGIEVV